MTGVWFRFGSDERRDAERIAELEEHARLADRLFAATIVRTAGGAE